MFSTIDAVLHLRDLVGADHAARLVGQRRVHGDDVRLREKLVERHLRRADLLEDGVGDVRVVGDDAHAEAARAGGDARADAAQADDAERLAVELRRP